MTWLFPLFKQIKLSKIEVNRVSEHVKFFIIASFLLVFLGISKPYLTCDLTSLVYSILCWNGTGTAGSEGASGADAGAGGTAGGRRFRLRFQLEGTRKNKQQ